VLGAVSLVLGLIALIFFETDQANNTKNGVYIFEGISPLCLSIIGLFSLLQSTQTLAPKHEIQKLRLPQMEEILRKIRTKKAHHGAKIEKTKSLVEDSIIHFEKLMKGRSEHFREEPENNAGLNFMHLFLFRVATLLLLHAIGALFLSSPTTFGVASYLLSLSWSFSFRGHFSCRRICSQKKM
jgi:hypothetical protein